ncbi:sigma-70 family RNA polymerase sigma factor [Candidatus Nomurabacteria bacterium]|nr:sigma-70 family RNA polymerase sigma factor [Candidatus Nomurabacteria bacterium]
MKQGHNDKNKFIESYDLYAEAIFRYCLFKVFDRERAKELMQETFTKTWEYLEKGKEVENLRAFLYKVAHNLCVNEIIRPKSFSLDEMSEKVNFNPEDKNSRSPENETDISLLIEKMKMLQPQEKEILTMRYIDDLAVAEIAELLGMIPNSVSVKIRRAEESLRKLYK